MASEAEEDEGLASPENANLRSHFVISGSGGCNDFYNIGIFDAGEDSKSVAIIGITDIDGSILVALPQFGWAQKKAERVLPKGALSKVRAVRVTSCRIGDRTAASDAPSLKIWLGLLDPSFEEFVKVDPFEAPSVDFPGEDQEQCIPFGPALVAVCQDHFVFQSAESQGAVGTEPIVLMEQRLKAMEEMIVGLTRQLAPGQSYVGPTPKKKAARAAERGKGLDDAVVQQALQSGVAPHVLQEMSKIVGPPGLPSCAAPAGFQHAVGSSEEEEEKEPGGGCRRYWVCRPRPTSCGSVDQAGHPSWCRSSEEERQRFGSFARPSRVWVGRGVINHFIQEQSCSLEDVAEDLEDGPEAHLSDLGTEVGRRLAGRFSPARLLERCCYSESLVRAPLEGAGLSCCYTQRLGSRWHLGLFDVQQGVRSSCSSRISSGAARPAKLRPGKLLVSLGNCPRSASSLFIIPDSSITRSVGSPPLTAPRAALGRALYASFERGLGLPGEEAEAHPDQEGGGSRATQTKREGEKWQGRSSTSSWGGRQEPRIAGRHSSGRETAGEEKNHEVPGPSAPHCNVLKLWKSMLRPFLRSKTIFSEFVHSFRSNAPSLLEGTVRTTWPMPLPYPDQLLETSGEELSFRRSCQQKAVNFVVLALNWLHLKPPRRAPTSLTMRRPLTSRQWRTVRRLEKFVVELGAEPTRWRAWIFFCKICMFWLRRWLAAPTLWAH